MVPFPTGWAPGLPTCPGSGDSQWAPASVHLHLAYPQPVSRQHHAPRIWPHCCVPSAATCPGCHHPSLGHSPPQALTLPRRSPLLHSGGGLEKHRVLLSGSHLKQAMPTTATKEVFFLEGGTASNMAWGPAPASLLLLQPHPPRHRPWPGHATPAALPSSFPPPPTAAAHPSRPNSGATLRAPKPHAQGTRAPCYLPPSTSHSGGGPEPDRALQRPGEHGGGVCEALTHTLTPGTGWLPPDMAPTLIPGCLGASSLRGHYKIAQHPGRIQAWTLDTATNSLPSFTSSLVPQL